MQVRTLAAMLDWRWILVGLVALGAALRMPLMGRSLWIDEIAQAVTATSDWPVMLETIRGHAAAAPFDYIGTRLTATLILDPTVGPRIWPFLVGLATIPAMYGAGRAWLGKRAGLTAAAAAAIAPFLVYYSAEARFYALVVLAAILNLWAFRHAGEHPVWFGLTVVLAILSSYTLGLLLVIEGIVLLARRAWQPIVAMIIAGLVVSPWLLYALPAQMGQTFAWGPPPFPTALAIAGVGLAGPGPLGLVTASIVSVLIGLALWRRSELRPIGVMAIVLVVGVWILAARANYFWHPRHVIALLPLAILLGVAGLQALRQRPARMAAGGTIVVLLIGSLPGLSSWGERQDWRTASAWLEQRTSGSITSDSLDIYIGYYQPSLSERNGTTGAHVVLSDLGTAARPPAPAGWRELHFGDRLWVYAP